MPKKMNVKKAAAGQVRAAGTLEEACDGAYDVGIVRGKLGFKGFNVEIVSRAEGSKDKAKERQVFITSKVVAAQGRAERDTFLVVDGQEVQMIVAKQRDLDRLRAAGRIPEAVSGLAEFFEMEEDEQELETWDDPKARARSNAERERMAGELHLAEEIVARIRAKRAGLLKKAAKDREVAEAKAAALAAAADALDDGHDEEEDLDVAAAMGLGGAAAGAAAAPAPAVPGALNRAERRAAALRAQEEAEAAAAEVARLAALAERYRAEEEAELREQEELARMRARAVPKSWEDEADEVDIEAI